MRLVVLLEDRGHFIADILALAIAIKPETEPAATVCGSLEVLNNAKIG